MLNDEEKKILLKIARDTIKKYLSENKKLELPELTGNLGKIQGAFVTLNKKGELRGCIGNMVGFHPLAKTIREMAIAASTQDPRFPSVTLDELDEIDIEISVLSPLKQISANDVEVGKHGLIVTQGPYQGVLLPQVATEYGWTKEQFLSHTCLKAGLQSDAWMNQNTKIEAFEADVFGEKRLT